MSFADGGVQASQVISLSGARLEFTSRAADEILLDRFRLEKTRAGTRYVNDAGATDQSQRYTKDEYETYGEALAVCREIVDRFLRYECASGAPASAVYFRSMVFGEEPSILEYSESPDTSPGFSAWDYAKARCEELCSCPAERTDQRFNMRPERKGVPAPSS